MIRIASLALALTTIAGSAAAQSESGAYVVTLGRDTISAESYTRTGNRIEGIITRRVPRVVVVRYTLELQGNGAWTLNQNTRLADGSVPPGASQRIVVQGRRDGARTEIVRDSGSRMLDAAVVNPFPDIDGAISFYRVAVAGLQSLGVDSTDFHAFPAGATQGDYMPIARRGPGRYWLYSFGSPIELTTDANGAIAIMDGSRTTVRTQARRIASLDVPALANAWAARERAGGQMSALSLNDSTVANVGAARVQINYGRPSLRGRVVWRPDGVLGDSIWRTGANSATRLIASAPITLGTTQLAAGNYVLTTLAIPGRYALIVSQNDREIARIPLATAQIPSVERFTIVIEGGRLRLRWDTLELSAPIG